MDNFSELMRHLRLQTRVFHRITHCGQWVVDAEYERKAMFHLVAAGQCVLRMDGAPDRVLRAGDAALFIMPCEHRLIATLDADAADATLLLCGYFEFDSPLAAVLLAALPAQLLLQREPNAEGDGSAAPAALLKLIIDEAANDAPGATALMDKLADALFVYALRACLVDGSVQRGLIAALADPHLAPGLMAMHRQPQQAWSVEALAGLGHLSRAAFARRFSEAVGTSPKDYLTRVRMQMARASMREQGISVTEAAALAGYATEAAFSRAFKRLHGYPPSQSRMP